MAVRAWLLIPFLALLGGCGTRAPGPGPSEKASAPARPDPKEPGGGFYSLQHELAFNVLDRVIYDAPSGQVSLVGHHDERYPGRPIPWLDHLAVLLESPRPEFTLTWTPESDQAVDALFKRLESPDEVRRMAAQWGQVFDAQHRVTPNGRWLLPLLGIRPVKQGDRPGRLGTAVKGGANDLTIVSVESNSAAARAGLRAGDTINTVGRRQLWHPVEFTRAVRAAGAGGTLELSGFFSGEKRERTIKVVLDAGEGDSWDGVDRYDLVVKLLDATAREGAGGIIRVCGMQARLKDMSPEQQQKLALELYAATGTFDLWDKTLARIRAKEITQERGGIILGRAIMASIDRTFGLPGNPVLDAYDAALKRGNSASAYAPAFAALDRQLVPLLERSMNGLLAKLDTVEVPPELVHAACGVRPEVKPEYFGVDPGSSLARVLFEADYAGKFLAHSPALREAAPRYVTDFEFARAHREPAGRDDASRMRLWFTVSALDFATSSDGLSLATRGAALRINIRAKGAGADAPLHPYGELLTSLYDDIATAVPSLHELRECAKLAGAARWLREKKGDLRLPKAGRATWKAPATIPGAVHLAWSPKPGAIAAALSAEGGVSLVLPLDPFPRDPGIAAPEAFSSEASIVHLPNDRAVPRLEPFRSDVLEKAARRPFHVPSPLRPGQVGTSDKGRQVLTFLSSLGESPDVDLERRRALDAAARQARRVLELQQAIDFLNLRGVERVERYEGFARKMERSQGEMKDATVNLMLTLLQQGRGIVKAGRPRGLVRALSEEADRYDEAIGALRSFEGKLKKLESDWQTASGLLFDLDGAKREQSMQNLVASAAELARDLKPGEIGPVLGRVLRYNRFVLGAAEQLAEGVDYVKGYGKLAAGYLELKQIGTDENLELKSAAVLNELYREATKDLDAQLKALQSR